MPVARAATLIASLVLGLDGIGANIAALARHSPTRLQKRSSKVFQPQMQMHAG